MIKRRRNLPHWRLDGALYFVTFRTKDSLPPDVRQAQRERLDDAVRAFRHRERREPTEADLTRLRKSLHLHDEADLDAGHGACPGHRVEFRRIARTVIEERADDGVRSYVVMPNHVHALLSPGSELSVVLKRWKANITRRWNAASGSQGSLWQAESYDHLVRRSDRAEDFVRYIADNPRKARLGPEFEARVLNTDWSGIRWPDS